MLEANYLRAGGKSVGYQLVMKRYDPVERWHGGSYEYLCLAELELTGSAAVSPLRRLRRLAAGLQETLRLGIFAAHRARYQQTTALVRAFYIAQIFHLRGLLGRWSDWLELDYFDGLWPLFWVPSAAPQLAIALMAAIFATGIFSASRFPERVLCRLLSFVGLMLAGALENSFGKIDHDYHAWIYVAFLLIFLPAGGRDLASSIRGRQKYLLVFAGAQASFLMTYTLAGFWKLQVAIQQAMAGAVGVFSRPKPSPISPPIVCSRPRPAPCWDRW